MPVRLQHSHVGPNAGIYFRLRGENPLMSGKAYRQMPFSFPDVDDHPFAVDIADLQTANFRAAQPCPIQHGEHGSVFQIPGAVQQLFDLLRTEDLGNLTPHLRLGDLLFKPRLFERLGIDELQCGSVLAEHFGTDYESCRARTWRLLPGIY